MRKFGRFLDEVIAKAAYSRLSSDLKRKMETPRCEEKNMANDKRQRQLLVIRRLLAACYVAIIVALPSSSAHAATAISCVFKNALLDRGQDPSVAYTDGYYYLIQSNGGNLEIRKSATLTGLRTAQSVAVFRPPPGQPYSYDLWAPELEYIEDHWYIYFAADDAPGHNAAHRIYALQANSADPLGTWMFKGKVFDANHDKWAIDPNVFSFRGSLYMVWSGWPTDHGDFPQDLYIARMSDPLTISSPRSMIGQPAQSWENDVQPIEEGPEAFIHNDQLTIVYSADASWKPAYKLGMLKLTGDDPMTLSSWTKIGPVFQQYSDSSGVVYAPGHNSTPVKSPDGTQDWLVYATKTQATDGWDDRDVRAQPFTWNVDNTPNFDYPIPANIALSLPSGEPCGLAARLTDEKTLNGRTDFIDLGRHLVDTRGSFSVAAWVRLDRTDGSFSIASQDGGIASGFNLHYSVPLGDKFAFTMTDGLGRNAVHTLSSFSPSAGTWYHIVGVRDAARNEIKLYVNDNLEGTTSFSAGWDALADTIVGAAKTSGQRSEYFNGAIGDVQIFNGALSEQEIRILYAQSVL